MSINVEACDVQAANVLNDFFAKDFKNWLGDLTKTVEKVNSVAQITIQVSIEASYPSKQVALRLPKTSDSQEKIWEEKDILVMRSEDETFIVGVVGKGKENSFNHIVWKETQALSSESYFVAEMIEYVKDEVEDAISFKLKLVTEALNSEGAVLASKEWQLV